MGSGGSKACIGNDVPSSSSLSVDKKSRSIRNSVFRSSCLGTSSGPHDNDEQVSDQRNQENGWNADSNQVEVDCYKDDKVEESTSSDTEGHHWGPQNANSTTYGAGSSSSRVSSTQSSNRFLPRFSFIPGNISFRLSRASSLGSSRAYPVSSTNFTVSDNEEEILPHTRRACMINRSPMRCYEGIIDNLPTSVSSHNLLNDQDGVELNLHSSINVPETVNSDSRLVVEQTGRFSRTLSVGRLRDRVLRRSSFSDLTISPLPPEREVRDVNEDSNVITSPTTFDHPLSSTSRSFFSNRDNGRGISRPREARYHDLVEHRSTFLERRRRIRSQVRALQRLGNRFENLSGHERSCILSGQHRTGHCTCRIGSRDVNPNDDTSARASISRIVVLAEALFEVLDEIHQHSVVLSSRPSVSSIGSVPAPSEAVESLPVKIYTKSQKYQIEDAAQCYICLAEYEEEDAIRIMPCHHEFHQTCVDKWLKEFHRVCPLCRGDVCKSSSMPTEN